MISLVINVGEFFFRGGERDRVFDTLICLPGNTFAHVSRNKKSAWLGDDRIYNIAGIIREPRRLYGSVGGREEEVSRDKTGL